MKGYIYILTNRSMPNLVKIGKTHRNPDERAEELSRATGVATPFDVVYYECFEDCDKTEKLIHQLLQDKGLRLSNNREFFEYNQKFNIKKIIDLISRLDGKIEEDELLEYNNNDDEDNIADLDSHVDSLIKEAYNYANGENGCLIDYDRAEELLLKAISIGNSERAYEELINLYNLDLDNTEKAIEVCKDAIKSGHKGLYLKLAYLYNDLYENAQDYIYLQNAKISFENCLKLPIIYKEKNSFYELYNLIDLVEEYPNKQKIKELYSEYYKSLKNTFFERIRDLESDNIFNNESSIYSFNVFLKLSNILDKKDFYEKLNKLKNICYNAEFDIMSTAEIDKILKENKDQILKIENDEKLLDFILEMFKKQNEEELDTEKWGWYISTTILTISIIDGTTDDIDDKAPIILCFGILYIIAIFIINMCFTNKRQELLKKYDQDNK